jgi:hypothetical protein
LDAFIHDGNRIDKCFAFETITLKGEGVEVLVEIKNYLSLGFDHEDSEIFLIQFLN